MATTRTLPAMLASNSLAPWARGPTVLPWAPGLSQRGSNTGVVLVVTHMTTSASATASCAETTGVNVQVERLAHLAGECLAVCGVRAVDLDRGEVAHPGSGLEVRPGLPA